MMRWIFRNNSRLHSAISLALAIAAVLAVLAVSGRMSANMYGSGAEDIETAVREAAASCYAAEGCYPDTLEYLIEAYGIRPDKRYDIHYEIFAPNLPPSVIATRRP